MRSWQALSLLAIALAVIALIPWERPHPNHIFMFELVARLDTDTSYEEPGSSQHQQESHAGIGAVAGHLDDRRSS